RNAGTLGALSGERVSKELLRTLEAPHSPDAVAAMAEAGALDRWLPEFAGTERLRGVIAREGEAQAPADGVRRLAAILPNRVDAPAIGRRLKLSTQEALRLEVMLATEPVVGRHPRAEIYQLGTTLFVDRVLLLAPADWQALLKLAR